MILDELLSKWRSLSNIPVYPPKEDILLWRNESRTIYLGNEWGPAVPYAAAQHDDGTENYGYRSLKNDPAALQLIPELQGFPEFEDFVQKLNSVNSPVETVGCEKGFFEVKDKPPCTTSLGSYTDVIFSDVALNGNPENLLRLAAHLMETVEGCAQWWAIVELCLQPMRRLQNIDKPWCLMIRVSGFGRTEDEARKNWGVTLSKLSGSVV